MSFSWPAPAEKSQPWKILTACPKQKQDTLPLHEVCPVSYLFSLRIRFSTRYFLHNYCCSNNSQQPDPFIGRRWLRIAPVFANTGNRQQKTILFHYTGYGFVFDHSTGRNDFNAGFLPAGFAFTAILSPEQKTRKYAGSWQDFPGHIKHPDGIRFPPVSEIPAQLLLLL